jgi:predicted DNA-binding transcriptional regulator AlpA
MRDYFTTSELAGELELAENTLRVWRVQGRGPKFLKLGSRVVYRRSDIEEWLSASTYHNTSEVGARGGR